MTLKYLPYSALLCDILHSDVLFVFLRFLTRHSPLVLVALQIVTVSPIFFDFLDLDSFDEYLGQVCCRVSLLVFC